MEKQIKFFSSTLRESKSELNSAGKLAIVISFHRFKKLLHLCVRWSEVKNWLSVCKFTSDAKMERDHSIQESVIQELLRWGIRNTNHDGIYWVLSHRGKYRQPCAEAYHVEIKESRKIVETVCISNNVRMQLLMYQAILAQVEPIIAEHKMTNAHKNVVSILTKQGNNQTITMLLNDLQNLSKRFGSPAVVFCRKPIIRLLFRIFATISSRNLDRHHLFRIFMEWILKADASIFSYLLFENSTDRLSLATKNIMRMILQDSKSNSDNRLANVSYQNNMDRKLSKVNINLLTQYAYLVCENDSPYFLKSAYEHLCAKNIVPFALSKNQIIEPNLEALYYLCCLCAISALPQCIVLMNHVLSCLWKTWKTFDSSAESFKHHVQKTFPKLHKQSKGWKLSSQTGKCYVSSIIRSFILAASAEYISPKDVEGWNVAPNILKKISKIESFLLPSDSHFAVFESIPSVDIPPFFRSVHELMSLLGPKVSSLLAESQRLNKVSQVTTLDTGLMIIKISQILFYTRYGLPTFIEKFVLNPKKACSEPTSIECILYENSEVIIIYKSSGTNIAPTSKVDSIKRIENFSANLRGLNVDKCKGDTNTSIRGDTENLDPMLNENLNEIFVKLSKVPRYGIIHRIDNEASGIVMLAKSYENYCFYKNLFFQSLGKTLRRKYIAILHFYRARGLCSNNPRRILEKHNSECMKEHIHALGLRSSIIVNTLEVVDSYALVRIELFHGMKHAIRRMISDPSSLFRNPNEQNDMCGECVILGETLYGPPGVGCTTLICRLALHAESMNFPLRGSPNLERSQISVEVSMPVDMVTAWTTICTLYSAPTGTGQ